MNRRAFLHSAAATTATLALARSSFSDTGKLTHKERVDRALSGQDVDRPPFTFYLHYKRPTAQLEAQDHLDFHRAYITDIVKVMNDFDYPKSTTGKWWELKPLDSPYPQQLETLRIIRDNLNGESGYSYMVKLDNTYAALNEWDNQLQVDDREGSDIPPLARIDTFDSMCAEYRALDPEA